MDKRWAPRATPLYRGVRVLTLLLQALFIRARVTGVEHVPASGPLLVVSNHLSIADPVILFTICPRPLLFMAKEEIFRPLWFRIFLRLWGGAFPVRRGETDVRAVREALGRIRAGAALVVFPEGTRRPEGIGQVHPGIGYLASRAACPVLPVAIMGSEAIASLWSLWHRPWLEVRFGEPFSIPEEGPPDRIADTIMRRIASLLPPERRGVYADESQIMRASTGRTFDGVASQPGAGAKMGQPRGLGAELEALGEPRPPEWPQHLAGGS